MSFRSSFARNYGRLENLLMFKSILVTARLYYLNTSNTCSSISQDDSYQCVAVLSDSTTDLENSFRLRIFILLTQLGHYLTALKRELMDHIRL